MTGVNARVEVTGKSMSGTLFSLHSNYISLMHKKILTGLTALIKGLNGENERQDIVRVWTMKRRRRKVQQVSAYPHYPSLRSVLQTIVFVTISTRILLYLVMP